jgi:tellurite resistance protein
MQKQPKENAMQPSTTTTPPTSRAWPAEASIRHLPINLFASVMGLSGLALSWRLAHDSLGAPAIIGEAIGALAVVVFVLLALGYLTKLAKYPQTLHSEFHHPIAGNFFGTIVISLLLLSAVIAPYSAGFASSLWTAGVVATFALSWVVVSRLLKGQVDATHAVPAWLIPGVATLDIAVTGGHMPMAWAADIKLAACAVGTMLALLLLSVIFTRLVHRETLPAAMTPSLMILVAPFAVGFLAYTNIIGGIDRFAGLLYFFALFMFAVVAPKVFRRGVPFTPAWWAISFPMAALASAALRYAEFQGGWVLWLIAVVLLGALTVALAVLTVKTVLMGVSGRLFV